MPLMIGIGILLILGIGAMLLAVMRNRQTAVMGERIATFTAPTLSIEELELQLPFRERVLTPLARTILATLGRASPGQNAEKLRRNLELAGNPNGLTPAMFVGLRITLFVVLLGLFYGLTRLAGMPSINQILYTSIGGAIGYLLPGIWLGQKIKARKKDILKSLPDALDLLSISVEAGLGFDLALQRVADKWDNELSKEFTRVLSDARLGIPRREAMRAMAQRCGVEDLSAFVSAIIQAEQLGVSMTKILRVQSEQLRIRRRQRAEMLAQQAAIKMLFPMVFLIFPSIMIIILGPAIPAIMGQAVL